MVRPERIELPTSWFVAMHSIQLSYGRIVAKLRLCIITETESFPPTRSPDTLAEKTLSRVRFTLPIRAQSRAGCGNRGPSQITCRNRRFVNLSKSFRPSAKPTYPSVLSINVGKALAMAADMLLLGADEVARNGAFGKKLRPEVFPDAPLQCSVCRQGAFAQFPALPQESSLE
jgi:hypothetical protein